MTENKIQPMMWDSRWVPFSDFAGSARLILDLRPGVMERMGKSGRTGPAATAKTMKRLSHLPSPRSLPSCCDG
jgi:hypothetical protein